MASKVVIPLHSRWMISESVAYLLRYIPAATWISIADGEGGTEDTASRSVWHYCRVGQRHVSSSTQAIRRSIAAKPLVDTV